MKAIQFEHVAPNQINIDDIVMCFCHDDQWERRAARVTDIELDAIPGVYIFEGSDGFSYPYDYRVWLTCRHVNLKRLDAEGGPAYRWHHFPWNKVARYLIER